MKNSSEESLFLGEIHRNGNNWQRSDKHGQNQSCLTRNYQETNCKIFLEQPFPNLNSQPLGPCVTHKTGDSQVKFFGIYQIHTAMIPTSLNSFFKKPSQTPKNPH
jgi:hypothetical protein